MIVNSMADAQVDSNDLIEFKFRDISYEISTSEGTLQGTVGSGNYRNVNVTSLGNGPYKVSLGYVNHSYQAAPVSVSSANALCTFWMAFPAGPNGPKTFVFDPQS